MFKRNHISAVLLVALAALLLAGCGRKKPADNQSSIGTRSNSVAVAYISDFAYMNPIIQTEAFEQEVCLLIFPRLCTEVFDTTQGRLSYTPSFATRWEIEGHKQITLHLRSDVKWQDGKPVTSADYKFSYSLYADTLIASARQNYCNDFFKDAGGNPDIDKSILTPNDSTLVIKFAKALPDDYIFKYINLQFIPKHHWEVVDRKAIRKDPRNFEPDKIIGCGPFKVKSWTRTQETVLVPNPTCTLPHPAYLEQLVVRVVPDYTNRLTQLQTGQVDIVQTLKPDDAKKVVAENPNVEIKQMPYKFYDYVAWMNIDQVLYNSKKIIKPHPLFGSKKVRQALTYAINRQSIVDGFLKEFGRVADDDISPIFKWVAVDGLNPFPYDKDKAKKLLAEEGWKVGSDGILEKDGQKFSFSLVINNGNARRNYAATIIQQNLKDVNIECKIDQQEGNVVIEKSRLREYDSFLFGWSVSLDIDPSEGWSSDLEKTPFNLVAFQNKRVDELIVLGKSELDPKKTAEYWKEYRKILNEEQPTTFLQWQSELEGFNKRIKNVQVTPVGVFQNAYDWKL